MPLPVGVGPDLGTRVPPALTNGLAFAPHRRREISADPIELLLEGEGSRPVGQAFITGVS
jgi:hypothetical protein